MKAEYVLIVTPQVTLKWCFKYESRIKFIASMFYPAIVHIFFESKDFVDEHLGVCSTVYFSSSASETTKIISGLYMQ